MSDAARHGASCGVMVLSEGDGMSNSKERDAVGELAELREDRDKWQTRAVQAEGRASNLAKDLIKQKLLINLTNQLMDFTFMI